MRTNITTTTTVSQTKLADTPRLPPSSCMCCAAGVKDSAMASGKPLVHSQKINRTVITNAINRASPTGKLRGTTIVRRIRTPPTISKYGKTRPSAQKLMAIRPITTPTEIMIHIDRRSLGLSTLVKLMSGIIYTHLSE